MTADLLSLRPYQREAVDAVHTAHKEGIRRPAVVLPTGSGKTVMFSHLASEYLRDRGRRVVVLVHRDELADQAIAKLRAVAPHLEVGKVKAESDEIYADVMVCSVQTLSRGKRLFRLVEAASPEGCGIGLVITDECHHGAAKSYQTVYDAFPDADHVGFTATLARGDGVGLGSTWTDVVYTRSVLRMVADGYLVDVRGRSVAVDGLDLSAVKRTGGDFNAASLGKAMEDARAPDVIAAAVARHAADRRGIIVFTPTVALARAVVGSLASHGIPGAVVSGETPREERLEVYDRFRTGSVRALVNCMVLTEGFDAPWADCAVIARPTRSQPLFVQMVGRVLRTWPGKRDALVLNLADSGGKLSTLIDLEPGSVEEVREGESLGEAVVREDEESQRKAKRGSLAFQLAHRDMDLFAASSNNWVRTPKGVLAIPCAERQWVFLWPCRSDRTLWDVCVAGDGPKWKRLRECLPIGTAQAWAETEAEDRAGYGTHRGASWMRKPASDAQLDRLRRGGVLVNPAMKAGEASALLDQAFATRLFDRYVKV